MAEKIAIVTVIVVMTIARVDDEADPVVDEVEAAVAAVGESVPAAVVPATNRKVQLTSNRRGSIRSTLFFCAHQNANRDGRLARL